MIMSSSFMRYPPPPSPEKPRMWKSLGIIRQDPSGACEAHYALDRFDGDYDIDTEADLRTACQHLLTTLLHSNVGIDPDRVYVLQGRFMPRVRLACYDHGVVTFVGGRQ